MVKTDTHTHYRIVGRVVLRRIGPENLLVPVSGPAASSCCVFPLNPTGLFIWEKISMGEGLEAVVKLLAEAYGLAPEQALADTQAFIRELMEQQLIEPCA